MKITKFHITNYRSLVDFKVETLDTTTIFFGLNNAGKSNILSALHTIFRRKEIHTPEGPILEGNFYEGSLPNFSSNFFEHKLDKEIEFLVDLQINTKEFNILEPVKAIFNKAAHTVSIKGKIISKENIADELAEMRVESISVDNTPIFLNATGVQYFPSLLKQDSTNVGDLRDAFTAFINPFNDCVYIIGSGRDMHPIQLTHKEFEIELSPRTFKKFLYSLYLNEKRYKIFEEINDVFASSPFSFGSISFSKTKDGNLEVMVQDNGIRLPIRLVGSGVLQILYIIAAIIYNKARIVCIEELEQNLSPKLQSIALRKFQSMLAGTAMDQIILTSHSSVFTNPKMSGAVYVIEKTGNKTTIAEQISGKFKAKAKAHFIDSSVEPTTYTADEYKAHQDYLDTETKKMVENRFNA